MTYTQFRRMKPKYKLRLVMVCVVGLLLIAGFFFGLSAGMRWVGRVFNTQTLENVTAVNVLSQTSYDKLLAAVKETDGEKIFVESSKLTCTDKGIVSELEIKLVHIPDASSASYFTLNAQGTKTTLRKTNSVHQNMSSLKLRLLKIKDYYPALSRVNSLLMMQSLEEMIPVGTGGRYTFTDSFDNNVEPNFNRYLSLGLQGIWVSKSGGPSVIQENYVAATTCVPLICSAEAVDSSKSKGARIVRQEPREVAVILLETGPYVL